MQESERLFAELEPLVAGVGLVLVEMGLSRRGDSVQVRAVIYSPAGTGTAECSRAHRLMYPRLQELLGTEGPYLEVASPGIDKPIRSAREWAIFKGKGARVLLKEGGDWIRGRIVDAGSGRVVLATSGGELSLEFDSIAKAKLDSSQEGD